VIGGRTEAAQTSKDIAKATGGDGHSLGAEDITQGSQWGRCDGAGLLARV